MTPGSLPSTPSIPIGQVIRSNVAGSTPREASRRSNWRRFASEPISPKYAKSSRRRICSVSCSSSACECVITRNIAPARAASTSDSGTSERIVLMWAAQDAGNASTRESTQLTLHGIFASTAANARPTWPAPNRTTCIDGAAILSKKKVEPGRSPPASSCASRDAPAVPSRSRATAVALASCAADPSVPVTVCAATISFEPAA